MDKGTILKQLKSVDNPSFFTLGGKEIAKDLQELLTEDETVQGFVEIFEKNIGRVFSNGARKNGLRSYLVITDRNVFFIRRGRLSLNLITALDKTIAIPITDISNITLEKSQNISKLLYPVDVYIHTNIDNYEFMAYESFITKLPANILPKVINNFKEEKSKDMSMNQSEDVAICPSCGATLEKGGIFCMICGKKIPEKKEQRCDENGCELIKLICKECGYELEEGTQFCPNCGKKVEEEKEEEKEEVLRCKECGYELEEGMQFCPNCGKKVEEEKEEVLRCKECGYELEEGTQFCPNCGKKVEEEKEEVLKCKECGYELEEGTRFCPVCGTPVVEKKEETIQEKIVCSQCGYELNEEIKFCPNCGSVVLEKQDMPEKVNCSKCGAKIDKTMVFCPECGQEIK